MKRLLAVYLMLFLFAGSLTGCGGSNQENVPEEIVWVLLEEDEKLYNNLAGIQKIEEATGVNITFELMTKEEYNYMLASGKYPDVMVAYLYNGEVLDLFNRGVAIEVSELVENNSTYLKAIYEDNPDIYREAQTNDGKLIYFPSLNPMKSNEDFYRLAYSGLIIRQDWLDKLGLGIPTDIEEWHTVLTAFKTRDPNGNGMADEIPFDDSRYSVFGAAFGVFEGISLNKDNQVIYGPMEDEYKEFLMTMNQWYEEGLIGQSAVTGSSKWSEANIINDISGAFYGLDNAWRVYLPSLLETNEQAVLTAVPIPKAEDGESYASRANLKTHIRDQVTVITSACRNPEAAMKVIDYMYSEEGSDYLTWGIDGETYQVGANGAKYLLPGALEIEEDGYIKLHHVAIGHIAFPKYDGETVVLQTYPEEQLVAEKVWADCDTSLIYPPNILFPAKDRERVNELLTDIGKYVEEMRMAYVTGEKSLDTFDEFRNTLVEMGIEEVIEIYSKNYKIYQEKGAQH